MDCACCLLPVWTRMRLGIPLKFTEPSAWIRAAWSTRWRPEPTTLWRWLCTWWCCTVVRVHTTPKNTRWQWIGYRFLWPARVLGPKFTHPISETDHQIGRTSAGARSLGFLFAIFLYIVSMYVPSNLRWFYTSSRACSGESSRSESHVLAQNLNTFKI